MQTLNLPPAAPEFSFVPAARLGTVKWLDGGVALVDAGGVIVEVNAAFAAWLGEPAAALAGQSLAAVLADHGAAWAGALDRVLAGGQTFARTDVAVPGDPTRPAQWFTLEAARHPGGAVLRFDSVLPPLSELEDASWDQYLKSEAARREMFFRLLRSEAQLQQLTQRWPGIIFSQRPDCTFHFVSPAIEALTGVPPEEWRWQTHRFWQVVHEADAEQVQLQLKQAAKSRKPVTTSYRIRHVRTGRVVYILEHREAVFSGNNLLLGYEGVWLDVTRQTIAEKRLSSAAWKETLGLLTMGLAHDFSNIMAGIHSLAENFQMSVDVEHPFHEGLKLICDNSRQASQLVQRIMHLHRGKLGERNYHDLNELVRDTVDLVRKIVPRRLKIVTELAPASLAVYADAVEFRQVLINLALNAVDAMPGSGQLTVATTPHSTFPPLSFVQGALPRLPAVCLSVTDTGTGIPARHLPSIFDPFFTTKEMNKGSGLGLYNARLFVEKHHGAISVETSDGGGTTFRLWLPEADFTEGERQLIAPIERHTLLLFGAPGQTLDSTAEFLRQHGFYVVMASTEAAALEYLQSPYYQFAAAIQQATAQSPNFFADIKKRQVAVKTVLHVIGCNQDELGPELLSRADAIIPGDSAGHELLERLRRCLTGTAASGA